MVHNTLIRRASPHVLLVILLAFATLLAGCGGRPAPTTIPAPGSAPEAVPALASGSALRLVFADFDNCSSTNNLGGSMGAAYNPPDSLKESYPQEPNRGCVARLEYQISGWSAFWLKSQGADLRPFSALQFDVRADPQLGIPGRVKLEIKRPNEVSVMYVSGIGPEWKTIRAKLSDFGYAGYGKAISSRQDVQELVITFEATKSGPRGVVFLDNLTFVR